MYLQTIYTNQTYYIPPFFEDCIFYMPYIHLNTVITFHGGTYAF